MIEIIAVFTIGIALFVAVFIMARDFAKHYSEEKK